MVRILSVVDAYTRECLALEADTSLGNGRLTRVLERLIAERGRPENVRSDNGPKFTSRRMLSWAEDWRSARCTASLVGRCRTDTSRASTVGCATSAQHQLVQNVQRCTLTAWREEYTWERPHSSPDYHTSEEFRLALEGI
jgi:putative transposase